MEAIPTIAGLDAQELESYIPVTMESCSIQPIGGKGLTTWGVTDCVVIGLYNPERGIYLGHFLRYNFFFPDQYSAACPESKINECKANIEAKKKRNLPVSPLECLGISISESLPKWSNQPNTICYMYSQDEEFLEERAKDMVEYGFKGKFNKYNSDRVGGAVAISITNSGEFGEANIKEYSEIPVSLREKNKLIDLKIFVNQIFYSIEQGHYKINNVEKNTLSKLQKYISIQGNGDIILKEKEIDLKNYTDLLLLRGKFARTGLIYRECVYPKKGGKRKTRNRNKKRQTRRK